MKKERGFTLIELLAVIIILGVIMLIAIPSVTRYINDSRKETYIDTARQIVKGAIPIVNSGELDVYDMNTTYYIPASCIPTENAMSSPFGDFVDAYVIVGYTGEGYVYYWASVDSAHQGIEMKEYNKLTKSDVKPNLDKVDTKLGIGSKSKIKILDKEECNTFISENTTNYPEGKTKETLEIGDLITIGDEGFYVYKKDGDDIYLLARYNLNVGNHTKPGDPIGVQNKDVVGINNDGLPSYGGVPYSNTDYWNNKIGTTYPGDYCYSPNYNNCAYVYDNNSNFYVILETYKNYLTQLGGNIKRIELMSIQDAASFYSAGYGKILFVSSFDLGSPFSTYSIYYAQTVTIEHGGGFFSGIYHSSDSSYGVRPVIVI